MADTPRRGRGRPPLDASSSTVQVTVRVPAPAYDAIYQRASRERCSMSEAIRRQLGVSTSTDEDADD